MLRHNVYRYYYMPLRAGALPPDISPGTWPFCPKHIQIIDRLNFLTKHLLPRNDRIVWGFKGHEGSSAFVLGSYRRDSFFQAHTGVGLTRNLEARVIEWLSLLLPPSNGHGPVYSFNLSPQRPLEVMPLRADLMAYEMHRILLLGALKNSRKQKDSEILAHLLMNNVPKPAAQPS